MKLLFNVVLIFILVLPQPATAQMSSINYSVDNYSVGSAGQTTNASSSNYNVTYQAGSFYEYSDLVQTTGGGGGSGTTETPSTDPSPTPTPTTTPSTDPSPTPTPIPTTYSSADSVFVPTSDPNVSTNDIGSVDPTESNDFVPNKDQDVQKPTEVISETSLLSTNTVLGNVSYVIDKFISNVTKRIGTMIKEIIVPEIVQQTAKVVVEVSPEVGLGAGALMSILFSSRIPFSLSSFFRILSHGGGHSLVGLFGFWKRRRPWGTVYDTVTKVPVDSACVELFNAGGDKQAETITDLDGRYGFVVPEGAYTMKVKKSNYIFPAQRRPLSSQDTIFDNVYYGESFTASDSVVHDIPMDPEAFDWNQFEKMRTHQTRFIHKIDPYIVWLFEIIFYLGMVISIWQFLAGPSLYTGVILIIYTLLLVFKMYRGKPPLYGILTKNCFVLPFAIVRVMQGPTQVGSKVTDKHGRYVIFVAPGVYTIRIEELVGEDTYETIYNQDIFAQKGIINESIKL
jgi:hypothetical protein